MRTSWPSGSAKTSHKSFLVARRCSCQCSLNSSTFLLQLWKWRFVSCGTSEGRAGFLLEHQVLTSSDFWKIIIRNECITPSMMNPLEIDFPARTLQKTSRWSIVWVRFPLDRSANGLGQSGIHKILHCNGWFSSVDRFDHVIGHTPYHEIYREVSTTDIIECARNFWEMRGVCIDIPHCSSWSSLVLQASKNRASSSPQFQTRPARLNAYVLKNGNRRGIVRCLIQPQAMIFSLYRIVVENIGVHVLSSQPTQWKPGMIERDRMPQEPYQY